MMPRKRKVAAVVVAALIGVSSYGVYSTTLGVSNTSTGFSAGSVKQTDVTGFPTVAIDSGTPVFDAATSQYVFANLKLTPGTGSTWQAIAGKKITVTAYNSAGTAIQTGSVTVPGSWSGQTSQTIPLTAGDANTVAN